MDRNQILDSTLKLSRSVEANALSYRRIAADLEVDPAALYRYFSSKSELVAAAIDRLWEEIVAGVDRSLPWRERLVAGAEMCFGTVVAHPAIGIDVAHRSTGGPGELGLVDLIIEAVLDAGVTGEDVVRFYSVYTGTVLALAGAQAALRIAESEPSTGSGRAFLADHVVPDPSRFPLVFEYALELEATTHRDVFDRTVTTIVDDIARHAAG